MKHLEPYGYEENKKFSPYHCCDHDINIHLDYNNEKDTEQDEQIDKKANVSDVQSAFTIVADAIDKNTSDIHELSAKVETLSEDVTSAITEAKDTNEWQSQQISELSAKTADFVKRDELSPIASADTDDFYTKEESDDKFVTSAQCMDMMSNKVDTDTLSTLVDTIQNNVVNGFATSNAAIVTNQKDIDTIKHILGTSSSEPSIKTQIDGNHGAIEAILKNHIPALQESINKKADNDSVVNIVNTLNHTIAANTDNLVSSIKGNQEAIIDIKHILGTSSSEPSIKTQIDGNHAAIEAIISTDIPKIESELNDKIETKADKHDLDAKADKDNFDKLSDKVNAFDDYVRDITLDKADKKDLEALSDRVDKMEGEDKGMASKIDLEAISAVVDSNSASIHDLLLNKQDKGDYVLTSALNNYCVKDDVYLKADVDGKLAVKQPKGDYVSANTLNNYYTKEETIKKEVFNEFVDNVNASAATFADKDLVSKINSRLEKVESSTNTVTESLSNLRTEVRNDYTTKEDVSHELDDVTSAITKNNTLIAKISEIDNLDKYNPETGSFDDSGNGVLDVLHREFHDLTDGYSEGKLAGLLKSLEDRIAKLEEKLQSKLSGDTIVAGDVDRTDSGRTLTLIQSDGDKLDIPLKDMFKKNDRKIEIVSNDDKLYLSESGHTMNASELLYMLNNDTY